MEGFGESVDATDAYAVKAAGDFIGIGIELTAGVQFVSQPERPRLFFRVHIDRNATALSTTVMELSM